MRRAKTVEAYIAAGFSAFKSYVGIWFYQGVFLSDPEKKLISAQEKTKGMRQWRFSGAEEILENRDLIRQYLEESIRNQEEGKEIKVEQKKDVSLPDEFQDAFKSNPLLKDRFESFTPGKQGSTPGTLQKPNRKKPGCPGLRKSPRSSLKGSG